MPVKACQLGGKPGYKWGDAGKCYTYDPDDEESRDDAHDKAVAQGVAIGDIDEEQAGCGREGERKKKRKQRHSLIKRIVIVERK